MGFFDNAKGKLKAKEPNMDTGQARYELGHLAFDDSRVLTNEQRQKLMRIWMGVSPEKRKAIRETIQIGIAKWESLPEEKREEILSHIKTGIKMGAGYWRSLPEAKRTEIKRRLRERANELTEGV